MEATSQASGSIRLPARFSEWSRRLWREEVDGRPLAAVRIAFNALFFVDLLRVLPRHESLYFYRPDLQLLGLTVWACSVLLLTIGLWTRHAALAAFLCGLFYIVYDGGSYHADYYQQIATFYFMFADSGRCWSVDAALSKLHGRKPSYEIWHLPLLAFKIHLASIYLDAGLSHLMATPSWSGGYAISQSLIHPQWSTELGRGFSLLPGFAFVANWATIAFEIGFLFLLIPYLLDRRRVWLSGGLGIAAFTMHAGITVCYDIGLFGPQPALLAILFVPGALSQRVGWRGWAIRAYQLAPRETARADDGDNLSAVRDGRAFRRATAILIAPVLLSALVVQPLPRAVMDKSLLEGWSPRATKLLLSGFLGLKWILRIVSDVRPHNVFSDYSQGVAFTIQPSPTDNWQPEPLFNKDGERVGHTRYMRNYMLWYFLGQQLAWATVAHRPTGEWRRRFELITTPLLREALSVDTPDSEKRIDFVFQAWRVPEAGPYGRKLDVSAELHLATAIVSSVDGKLSFRYEYPEAHRVSPGASLSSRAPDAAGGAASPIWPD